MTPETARFVRKLISLVTNLSADNPDFDMWVDGIRNARAEIAEALGEEDDSV